MMVISFNSREYQLTTNVTTNQTASRIAVILRLRRQYSTCFCDSCMEGTLLLEELPYSTIPLCVALQPETLRCGRGRNSCPANGLPLPALHKNRLTGLILINLSLVPRAYTAFSYMDLTDTPLSKPSLWSKGENIERADRPVLGHIKSG